MAAFISYSIAFYMLWLITHCSCKRGFILTSPKVLDAGSTEYFPLTLFDVPQGGSVWLRLLKANSDDVISESNVYSTKNNMWMEMDIPSIPDENARLNIVGEFNSEYQFNAVKDVRIRHKSVIVFIQTDKPVYKPSQTVRFRVLPMNINLKPFAGYTVGHIWIEDPSGVRVAQWKSVKFSEGIVQLELPLSDEPVLGEWKIKASIRNTTHSQTFIVKEYVLPKFEVLITPPSYVMNDAVDITIKICALYTYGKKVDGMLQALVRHQLYTWEKNKFVVLPQVIHEGKISGCYDFQVKTADLLLDHYEFSQRKLEIFAEVIEDGTEVTRNATYILQTSRSPLKITLLGAESFWCYYKPGLPFHGMFKVTKPDYTPAGHEEIEVCATVNVLSGTSREYCRTFISDKHGHFNFSIPSQDSSSHSLSLRATAIKYVPKLYSNGYTRITQPRAFISLRPWFSPSGSHLQIEPIYREVQCEKLEEVKVRYTAEKEFTATFYHQVISRGLIVQQGSHHRSYHDVEGAKEGDDNWLLLQEGSERLYALHPPQIELSGLPKVKILPHVGEFILSFNARATMSPTARLLVFYVRSDGEVVADSLEFRIAPCFSNKARLNFRHEQQYPSTETAILLSASPFSLCGIGLVDKSVHLLNPEKQLTVEKVFEFLESYDVNRDSLPKQVSMSRCESSRHYSGKRFLSAPSVPPPRYRRSYLFHPHDYHFPSVPFLVDTMTAFEEAGMVVITDYTLERRPCLHESRSMDYPIPLQRGGVPYAENRVHIMEYIDKSSETQFEGRKASKPHDNSPPKSAVEIRNYFPETWLWELIDVGETGEVTFKRELPHTITKWMGSAICVHPQSGLGISDVSSITAFQPFFISYTLPYSVVRDEVVPLIVSVFNYLSECLPIKLSLEPSEFFKIAGTSRNHKLCVCGGKSESHKFLIRPVALGEVNITVYGYSMEEDIVCENEITARLSAKDAVTKSLLVSAEGFPKEEVTNIYFCPQQSNGSYIAEVNLLLPENVVEGSSRAYVSVNGDLMGPALNGLDRLVKLPVGCGEQNMVLFTPNIFVLDYLTSTGRVTPEIESKVISHMKTGYQRELQYRHSDGSYSAFGKSDDRGSIWLTSFVVRSFAQAQRFISVDDEDLALSTLWIIKKQFENGCFEHFGRVLHKAMKGGLNDDEQSLAPLTAYVLIALLEANFTQPQVVNSALHCIQMDKTPSTYSLALFAYATALAKQEIAQDYLSTLESMAIKSGNLMYWDHEGTQHRSVSVETAGYAVLALLEIGGEENIFTALPIVRWITKQRNSNGGFVSTQDTVVALQALAKYASFNNRNDKVALSIGVESVDLNHSFEVNEDNKLVTQSVKIPTLPTGVDLHVVGNGCALAQFTFRYNVESVPGSDAFDLRVSSSRTTKGLSCSSTTIGICMRYKIPRQKTNMVVVTFKMASGFVPNKYSLQNLTDVKHLHLKRYDVNGNIVNFYFYELTNQQKCFQFVIDNEVAVENSKPATVKLYDYYQPELEVTTDYEIPSFCSSSKIPNLPELPPLPPDFETSTTASTIADVCTHRESPPAVPDVSTPTEVQYYDNATTLKEIDMEISSRLYPLDGDDYAVTSSATVSEMNDINDDRTNSVSPSLQDITTSRFLHNFVEVEHDLDTPDGLEGNTAVTLLPPEDFPINTTNEDSHLFSNFTPSHASDDFFGDDHRLESSISGLRSKPIDVTTDEIRSITDSIMPTFDQSMKNTLTVHLRETAYLTCKVKNLGDKSVSWIRRKDFHLLTVGSYSYTNDERFEAIHMQDTIDWILKIKDIQKRDEGFYECQINSDPKISYFVNLTVLQAPDITDCPVCLQNFPANFSDIYCSSAFVLKVHVRHIISGTVKIIHDLSKFYDQPQKVKEFGKLSYDKKCVCSPLNSRQLVLLIGMEADSWTKQEVMHNFLINSRTYIIPLEGKVVQPSEVKNARGACDEDP